MSRLPAIEPDEATGKTHELLRAVQRKLNITPNMTRVMANSPAVLDAYLSFSTALSGGALPVELQEEIALEVAEQNSCQYCLSAHTAIGHLIGLSDSDIDQARDAKARSPKHAASLLFARQIVAREGRVSDADFDAIKRAGLTNGEIAEIIAHVALNIFTNYFNAAAAVEIDFPEIALRQTA